MRYRAKTRASIIQDKVTGIARIVTEYKRLMEPAPFLKAAIQKGRQTLIFQ